MKLLATLLNKDLVSNQSDFQIKKKLSRKEYRNRFAFQNSVQADLDVALLEEFCTYVCM